MVQSPPAGRRSFSRDRSRSPGRANFGNGAFGMRPMEDNFYGRGGGGGGGPPPMMHRGDPGPYGYPDRDPYGAGGGGYGIGGGGFGHPPPPPPLIGGA